MKLCVISLATLLVASSAALGAKGTAFYVATNGKHINPGTKEKPFPTFERARRAIRAEAPQ